MLRTAQLYKEELNKKYIATWYNPKYMYYNDISRSKNRCKT